MRPCKTHENGGTNDMDEDDNHIESDNELEGCIVAVYRVLVADKADHPVEGPVD